MGTQTSSPTPGSTLPSFGSAGTGSSPPTTPDYRQLADATAASQAASAAAALRANRPNQTDQYGNTSTWSQDAAGNWSNQISMSPQQQQMYNQQQGLQSGAMNQAAASMAQPISTAGLQGYSGYDPSKLQSVNPSAIQSGPMGQLSGGGLFNMNPMGNSKEIQNATMALLQPQRDAARQTELIRLRNQGLRGGSDATQMAMHRLGQDDTDAQLKALLAGQTEYGNQYGRALDANKSNFDQSYKTAQFGNESQKQLFDQAEARQNFMAKLREQQFGEQGDIAKLGMDQRKQQYDEMMGIRNQPMADLKSIMDLQQQSPEFGKFVTATDFGGTDYTKAADSQNTANIARWNAEQAANNAKMQGLYGLAGSALNSKAGGMVTDAAGNLISKGFGAAADYFFG